MQKLSIFKLATASLFTFMILLPSISAAQSADYTVTPRSFVVAGTVFFDANGNGIHDVMENVYAQSAGPVCRNSISIPGLAVRIEYAGFSKDYPLIGCGTRGDGVFYESDPILEDTAISATLVSPYGYKSTWSKTQTLTVQSGQYLSFAVTEYKPEFKTIYPNGGEKIEKGKTITIRWKADEYANINLILYKGTTCEAGIDASTVCGRVVDLYPAAPTAIAINVANTGSYDWKVPSNLADGSDYRIAIQDPKNLPKIDQSDKVFTIFSAKRLAAPKFTACKSNLQCASTLIAACNKGSFQSKVGGTSIFTVNGKSKNGYCLIQLQHQLTSKTDKLKLSATYYIPSTVKSYGDLIAHINKVNTIKGEQF